MEKPQAVQKVGTTRFFQITKLRVAFFEKPRRGPKSWNRPFPRDCEAWRCLFKKPQAFQKLEPPPLFKFPRVVALIKATQLVETIGAVVLFRLCNLNLHFSKSPIRSKKLEPPVSSQITKLRVALFEKHHTVPKVGTAHFLEIAKLRVASLKKPQAVQQVGTALLFRLSFPPIEFPLNSLLNSLCGTQFLLVRICND